MLTTGDFSDPETRIPFSDSDLKTIDMLVKSTGGVKNSIFEAKKQPNMFADMKFRRDALLGSSINSRYFAEITFCSYFTKVWKGMLGNLLQKC